MSCSFRLGNPWLVRVQVPDLDRGEAGLKEGHSGTPVHAELRKHDFQYLRTTISSLDLRSLPFCDNLFQSATTIRPKHGHHRHRHRRCHTDSCCAFTVYEYQQAAKDNSQRSVIDGRLYNVSFAHKLAQVFLPPPNRNSARKELEERLQTTKLDRVLVVCVSMNNPAIIWFRLIGTGQTLSLKLGVPKPGSIEAEMEATVESVPEERQDLVEYRVEANEYSLAAFYALLCTQRLERWSSTEHALHCDEQVHSWA